MNQLKVVKSILNKVEKMDVEYPYSVVRSILMCEIMREHYDEKDTTGKKEIITLLENYFEFMSKYREIDGVKTLFSNYDLQNVFVDNKSFDVIKQFLIKNIINKKEYVSKCEYHYDNNYSQNVIEEESDFLDIIKNIIVGNEFQYGDAIFRIMDDLDLEFFLYFNNNRYKNTLIFSKYSLFNLINYFDYFLSVVDSTFKRDNKFLINFMITILFDQKTNYRLFYNVLQNKKLNVKDSLSNAENFIIRKYRQGFFKTKTQYYIKIGMNTNSKIRTFSMTQNKDILEQIHKATEKLSNETIFDLFYLSFINDKDLSLLDISKIDKIAEDIAVSNPKALVKSNDVSLHENKLVNDYIGLLIETAQQNNKFILENFTILNNIKNDYMIKLFEGKIKVNTNRIYALKIVKIKGIIYTYVNFKGTNIFKDRIFTKEDAIRIVEFIKHEEEWSK